MYSLEFGEIKLEYIVGAENLLMRVKLLLDSRRTDILILNEIVRNI